MKSDNNEKMSADLKQPFTSELAKLPGTMKEVILPGNEVKIGTGSRWGQERQERNNMYWVCSAMWMDLRYPRFPVTYVSHVNGRTPRPLW